MSLKVVGKSIKPYRQPLKPKISDQELLVRFQRVQERCLNEYREFLIQVLSEKRNYLIKKKPRKKRIRRLEWGNVNLK